jgi:hypothetical protein
MYNQITHLAQAKSNIQTPQFCNTLVKETVKLRKNQQNFTFYQQQQRERNYQSLTQKQKTKFHIQCVLLTRLKINGSGVKILRETFIDDIEKMFGQKISLRTFDRYIKELKDEGKVESKRGKKEECNWTASIYRLCYVDPDVYHFRKLNLYMRHFLAHRSNSSSTKNITISNTKSSSNQNLILEKVVAQAPTPPPNQKIEVDHYWPSGKAAEVLTEQVGDSYLKQEPIIEEFKNFLKFKGITKAIRRELNYQVIPFIKKSVLLRNLHKESYIDAIRRLDYKLKPKENMKPPEILTMPLIMQDNSANNLPEKSHDYRHWTPEEEAESDDALQKFIQKINNQLKEG